ncbi:hypothetical protein Pcinc_044260 [Petrolisthes cinctipes]|uniref:Uncharacterized protein n=1 Tax=Petrolisthes cinctipes TaxID=88211 RepID=A0AAE1BEK6_PETCI|nr:hypothetical protein Pcinc_044260 [Petrolisthes cinctipes]
MKEGAGRRKKERRGKKEGKNLKEVRRRPDPQKRFNPSLFFSSSPPRLSTQQSRKAGKGRHTTNDWKMILPRQPES